jgi:uncharacterized protein YabE (DUF348 family)
MRRGVSYALCGTLAGGLLAGAVVAWSLVDKSINISVDDTITKRIHTLSRDVRGALRDAGFPLGTHDEVTPPPASSIREGSAITLRRGRLLELTVDGAARQVWVAAPTVAAALASLGYAPDIYSSLPLDHVLPLTPTQLVVRTVKSVTLVRAGTTNTVDSTAPSVGQLLADEGISPGPHDKLSVPPGTPLSNGMMIVWQKVSHHTVTQRQQLDFVTTYRADPSMPKGRSRVATPGRPGSVAVTYDVMTVDGKPVAQTQLESSVLAQPVDRVVLMGSLVPKRPARTVAQQSAAPSTPASKPLVSSTPSVTPVSSASPSPTHSTVAPTPTAKPKSTTPSRPTVAETAPKPQPVVLRPAPRKPAPQPQLKPSPITTVIVVTPGSAQALARQMLPQWGWGAGQFDCLQVMWMRESSWRVDARNPSSGAYGIPQAYPATRMAATGPDWRTNPRTQIRWGLDYIRDRYGSPCAAWSFWQAHHWY